ncbi:MAG: hybrid sensor histidine kinase/response regulator [Geminicoccaceae bacterium]|nr:hybrid sensor histidine kinase/response regulator [Geminicoccaceae bacterium]
MDELLSEFLTECIENMTVLDVELVRLEQNPNDLDLIGSIFRIVHTIKGTCGFLGLPRLEHVAHASENVLGKFRDGEMPVTPAAVTVILAALDRIKEILDALADTQAEPEGDDSDLIAMLDQVLSGSEVVPAPAAIARAPAEAAAKQSGKKAEISTGNNPAPADVDEDVDDVPSAVKVTDAASARPAPARTAAAPSSKATDGEGGASKSAAMTAQTLRVPVDLLETLMTLVSELVLTRNQLLQMVRNTSDNAFKAPLQRLSHITSELQEGVMKTRMQPIGNAWSKLPRIVRDLAIDLGKQIELNMIGAETELDRQVLELIKDPLTHMVRNSADHGLEKPEQRAAAGKPEQGTITLNAFHEGGHIIIKISDDGKGLDVDRISQKIVSNGLASEADLASLSPQQIMQFIFKPGFSTAEQVTSVSGRGVGMDVVRTNIEKIGGSIELASELGRGSTFTIKIPLTLAIVSALIVQAGGERFAMPQIGVVELVRAGAKSEHRIEVIDGAPILRLRDRLLPLMSLAKLLGLQSSRKEADITQDAYVVVSQVGTCLFGLIVDQVYDTEEIVVKPVAPILRNVGVFSGNTILGDGNVVMIIDLNGITSALATTSAATNATQSAAPSSRDNDRASYLVFKAGEGALKAVPLSLVTRLEEIEAANIERSGHQTVMQYRGALMPLTDVDGMPVFIDGGFKPVLVFTDVGRNMGLVVDEIIDIAETAIQLEIQSKDPQVLGTAVIAGKATDLLDVAYFVNRIFGGWFMTEETDAFEDQGASVKKSSKKRLLMVDDSAFFRNMLAPLLESSGYDVTTATLATEALAMRQMGEKFDYILSDIEMPEMNGFEFAEACRDGGPWQDTPIIALSSHTTPQDIERGRNVGFTDYVGKLDRDALLHALANCRSFVGNMG